MTIVVDTSAFVAIVRAEDDARAHAEALGTSSARLMSAASLLEAGLVLGRQPDEAERFSKLLDRTEVQVVPFDRQQARIGIEAFARFGRGSGHRANLNFGDCFSYALAKTRNLPLLFKGDDFVHTDIEPALKPA